MRWWRQLNGTSRVTNSTTTRHQPALHPPPTTHPPPRLAASLHPPLARLSPAVLSHHARGGAAVIPGCAAQCRPALDWPGRAGQETVDLTVRQCNRCGPGDSLLPGQIALLPSLNTAASACSAAARINHRAPLLILRKLSVGALVRSADMAGQVIAP